MSSICLKCKTNVIDLSKMHGLYRTWIIQNNESNRRSKIGRKQICEDIDHQYQLNIAMNAARNDQQHSTHH